MMMIDWGKCYISAPLMLSHISDDELRRNAPIVIEQIQCHSQAVERAIKDITAASSMAYSHKSRHGMTLHDKKSRTELPRVDSKVDFK